MKSQYFRRKKRVFVKTAQCIPQGFQRKPSFMDLLQNLHIDGQLMNLLEPCDCIHAVRDSGDARLNRKLPWIHNDMSEIWGLKWNGPKIYSDLNPWWINAECQKPSHKGYRRAGWAPWRVQATSIRSGLCHTWKHGILERPSARPGTRKTTCMYTPGPHHSLE